MRCSRESPPARTSVRSSQGWQAARAHVGGTGMGQHVPGVRVRACGREEIGEVLGLWAAARTLATSVPDDRAALEKLLDHDEDCLLVAERAGRIVGTLVAAWDGWRGNMYRLVVLPDHRRQGWPVSWCAQARSDCGLTAPGGSQRWFPARRQRPRRSGQPLATTARATSCDAFATSD